MHLMMEANKKLQRIPHEGAVAGVCAGLGEYFAVDKTWIRVGFILTLFFAGYGIGFAGPLVYIILWVILPVKTLAQSLDPFNVDYRVSDPQPVQTGSSDASGTRPYTAYDAPTPPPVRANKRKSNKDKTTAGLILLGIGLFFLLLQLDVFHWRDLAQYWPVILIFFGLVNIVTAFQGRRSEPQPVPDPPATAAREPDDATEASEDGTPEDNAPKI